MQIWTADGEAGLMRRTGREFEKIGPPGAALCQAEGRIFCAGEGGCGAYRQTDGEEIFRLSLPTGVCALCTLGKRVCALSQDADSILAFCPRTGEMQLSVPAGMYPRDLCQSPCGKFLAVAGGAAGEMLIFDQGLCCIHRQHLPGVCCGVCFLPRGMMALCAVGEEALSTLVLRISRRGVAEEICTLPDAPCALCALPGGRWAAGCHGKVFFFRRDGSIFARADCPWPARIRPFREGTVICDGWGGEILSPGGRVLYRGREPRDVIVLP